jgi:hypothetical protein
MSQQDLDNTDTSTDTLAERLPQRPVESKATIMHDTSTDYFDCYVSNCHREQVLVRYLEIEADRAEPRQERIATANKRLAEMREQ